MAYFGRDVSKVFFFIFDVFLRTWEGPNRAREEKGSRTECKRYLANWNVAVPHCWRLVLRAHVRLGDRRRSLAHTVSQRAGSIFATAYRARDVHLVRDSDRAVFQACQAAVHLCIDSAQKVKAHRPVGSAWMPWLRRRAAYFLMFHGTAVSARPAAKPMSSNQNIAPQKKKKRVNCNVKAVSKTSEEVNPLCTNRASSLPNML